MNIKVYFEKFSKKLVYLAQIYHNLTVFIRFHSLGFGPLLFKGESQTYIFLFYWLNSCPETLVLPQRSTKYCFSLKKILRTRLMAINNRKIEEKERKISKNFCFIFFTICLKFEAYKSFKLLILEYILKNLAKKYFTLLRFIKI